MSHRITVELDGAALAANWPEAQKAYPLLAGLNNPRIRPDSRIVVDDTTPYGEVEVTIKMLVPPGPGG
jgi:hypothetical protein